jgi:hypothetical protein
MTTHPVFHNPEFDAYAADYDAALAQGWRCPVKTHVLCPWAPRLAGYVPTSSGRAAGDSDGLWLWYSYAEVVARPRDAASALAAWGTISGLVSQAIN